MDATTFKKLPVNIDLLKVGHKDLLRLGQVKDPQIFDNQSNFHPDGLFSTVIFGAVGSEHRSRMFGVIDLKTQVLHPLVYHAIINLKSFYKLVAEGKQTALWDAKTKEFVKSYSPEASTGYTFFLSHVHEFDFQKNDSDKRNFLIEIFEKSLKEDSYLLQHVLVLPAGLRDYTIDVNGKPQEDEINAFYRKLMSHSAIIDPVSAKKAPALYDNSYASLQNTLLELFEFIKSLLEGKNKLVLGKWLSRKIFNSTRNVLSSNVERAQHIKDPTRLGFNECAAGLHQFARAAVPKSTYEIKTKYIAQIFPDQSGVAYLTNAKTWKKEEVLNSHIQKDHDLWTSSDGLDKVIASLGNLYSRNEPVTLNRGRHLLGLVYRDNKHFKFFQDIDELPEGFSRENVSAVSLAEFIYMSIYELSGKFPGFVTRYPIIGFGGIYPAFVKLFTTVNAQALEELEADWQPSGKIASSFPLKDSDYFNTTTVHPSHLGALGGDHDGDTISLTMVLTDEATDEITSYLGRKEYYINDNGGFTFSNDTDTLSAVLAYMT